MKSNGFRPVGFLGVLGLLIPSIPKTKATLAGAPQAANSASNMVINEVLFNPDTGGYERVERSEKLDQLVNRLLKRKKGQVGGPLGSAGQEASERRS